MTRAAASPARDVQHAFLRTAIDRFATPHSALLTERRSLPETPRERLLNAIDEVKDELEVKDESDEKGKCFELVYPISYTMPDGTVISGNEEELKQAMDAWYEDHPDSNAKPELQYPVEIIIGDLIKSIEDESKKN